MSVKNPDARDLRSIRRLNRRVHDPIAAWLGSALASLGRLVRPTARGSAYPPERQDLYGFSANDFGAANAGGERR
jgi:hypothetical protein